MKIQCPRIGRSLGAAAIAFSLTLGTGAGAPADNLFDGVRNAVVAKDPDAAGGRCLAADVTAMGGTVFSAQPSLGPGAYRAAFRLKLPAINHINTAPLNWTLTVQGGGGAVLGRREIGISCVERAGAYQEFSCPFVLDRAGRIRCELAWQRVSLSRELKGSMRVEKKDIPVQPDLGMLHDAPDALTDDDIETMLAAEPPLASLKYLYCAVADLRFERVSDVAVESLAVDKIRYAPGEKALVAATVCNASPLPRSVTVKTVLIHDLDTVIPVDERAAALEPGGRQRIECQCPAFAAPWGYAVRCEVLEGTNVLAAKEEYFTVHSNFWAVSIAGRRPVQFTAHIKSREAAAASAEDNKRRYRNWVESGFWAPDEFGDFTPDTEFWWGGQGCYYGGVTGTKLMIEEGHKRGIAYAVYANIWGGDGPPAFELLRRHPDWGSPGSVNVDWLERWDRNVMGTGREGVGMHVWPTMLIDYSRKEAFEHHGHELIATHRTLGWDAVRYDSHAINEGNARVMDIVKATVRAEAPEFQFGYNSSVPQGKPIETNTLAAFRAECEGEGGIMEEGIRQFGVGGMSYGGKATYAAWARRLLDFKETARRNGGHFIAIGLDGSYPNDAIYMHILWLAGNAHPCYDWGEPPSVGDYMQFATRYAGQLWDLSVAPVQDPEKWVDYGQAATNLWLWKDFVHQRDLGSGRRQLILHLVNAPSAERLMTCDDNRLPPPRENIEVSVKLPGAPKVRGVWLMTPEYELSQKPAKYQRSGEGLRFSVPRLRFWTMAVVDLESAQEFAP